MEFKNINSFGDAYKYAEKRGGVPKVPFAIFWEFFPEDEEKLVNVARQVQQTFNMVQSTEPFKINVVEKVEEDLFDIEIDPGGLIPFKVDQDSFEQQQTARKIDERLDAHQKQKEQQKVPEKKKKEQKAPEKKERKTSDELYNEFKMREEKILEEIRAEALIKAKAEVEAMKAEAEAAKAEAEAAKAEVEAMKAEAMKAEAEVGAKVGADIEALINALAEAKADAKVAEARASETKTKKVEAKATTLKLFGYSVFEFSK